jgi:hypothetical protein
MPVIDATKPCEAAGILKQVLADALASGQVEEIEFTAGNGSSRRVRRKFASLDQLRAEIARYDSECKVATTGKPARYGLRAGGM